MQEPTLPLHLEAEWKYTSDQVGLVYLASFIPTLICQCTARVLTVFLTCFYSVSSLWLVV